LRRIEEETGVRRETAGAYLKAAGIGVRPPGAWGRRPAAKPANEVTTGSDATKPANTDKPNPNPENLSTKETAKAETSKPANKNEVTTGLGVELSDSRPKDPKRALPTSFCEPFRHVLKCGPRSWRPKMDLPPQEATG
jgi:predicted component of type VI protein secretion system